MELYDYNAHNLYPTGTSFKVTKGGESGRRYDRLQSDTTQPLKHCYCVSKQYEHLHKECELHNPYLYIMKTN